MIPDTEEIPTGIAPEAPEITLEPDPPKDPEEAIIRIADAMQKSVETDWGKGYHLEMTRWGPPGTGRIKVSTHVEDLGDLLQELTWINDVLVHFQEGEE